MHRTASLPVTARYLSKLARIPHSAASTSAIALLLLFVSSARAQTTWTVNTTNDSNDGSCTSTTCSLRDAINAANADSGDTINFSVNGTITLSSNLLLITANMTIQGPGATALTVSGNHAYQVFYINPFATTVSISGLTIANGNAGSDGQGGAIFNYGSTLTVTDSTFSGNSASGGDGNGGAINNQPSGTLTVTNSTFSGNSSDFGGGIYNGGTLTITNSTFSGNSAPNGGGGIYNAGGFFNATLTVSNSTFSANSANAYGGGIFNFGPLTVTNSTFSGNSAYDAGGIFISSGTIFDSNNLFFNNAGGDSSGFTLSPSDLTGEDPKLAPLGNYGGPTQTMLPLPDSAAICAGAPSLVPAGVATDQRGFPRTTTYSVSGNPTTCLDIGAAQTNYQSIQLTNIPAGGYAANVNQDVSPGPNVTVTENGQNRDGVPVTLSISGSPTANGLTATTANGNGATFSSLTVGAAGDYTLSATLNLNPATATPALSITTDPTANLTISLISTTVSISNIPASATYGGRFTPNYTVSPSDDTGARSVISLTASTCTVSGGTVNFVGAGTCTLQASVAATTNYQAATGSEQSFSIGQVSAMVSIPNIPASAMYGGSFTPSYSVSPSGDNGTTAVNSLTSSICAVSGGTVSFVGAGTCTLQASVAPTSNYQAATGLLQSFTIGQASASVSISNMPTTALIGGSFTPAYSVTPSADNGTTSVASSTTSVCTASGGTVNFAGVGTCTLQASVAPTTDYAARTGSQQNVNITYGIVALYSQTTPSNSGSTVPIKVQLTNSSRTNLSSSQITITVTGISPSAAPGKAPSGNFTFMSTSDAGPMYQLNVKTTGYPSGTYTLSFKASGDPVTHTVGFVIQ